MYDLFENGCKSKHLFNVCLFIWLGTKWDLKNVQMGKLQQEPTTSQQEPKTFSSYNSPKYYAVIQWFTVNWLRVLKPTDVYYL